MEEGALFQIGILSKEGGQGHIRAGFLHLYDVHQVGNGVILDDGGGDAGQHIDRIHKGLCDLTDLLGCQGQALLVKILHLLHEVSIRRDGRAVQKLGGSFVLLNGPLVAFLLQGEGHLADKSAVIGGLQNRNAGDFLIHLSVGVSDEQTVQLVSIFLSNLPHTFGAIFTVQTIVDGPDDHISLTFQLGEDLAGLFHGSGKGHVVIVSGVGGLPLRNVGSIDAEDGNLYALYLKDRVGVLPAGAVGLVDVAGQSFALKGGNGFFQTGKLKVKLMISQNPCVIAQGIHGLDHGVDFLVAEFLDVVGLQAVACVDQQKVWVCRPLLSHNGGNVGHAGLVLLIGGIVEGVDHAMEIAGLQNGDGYLVPIRCEAGCSQSQNHDQGQDQRQRAPAHDALHC